MYYFVLGIIEILNAGKSVMEFLQTFHQFITLAIILINKFIVEFVAFV